jgi:urease accessory protein
MRVNLAAGAQFVGWEITRFGRTARGEYFTAGDWRSRLEIWQDDDLLWSDRQWLPGIESVLKSPHGLAGNTVVGTLVWCGLPIDHHDVSALRNYGVPTGGEGGLSRLQGEGLICRYRGLSMTTARDWLMTLWQHLRHTKLHRKAVNLRVWT